jgi:DNA-binding NarL/FixJ family response regulator
MDRNTGEETDNRKILVALIDTRALVRECMASLLTEHSREFVVIPFSSAEELCANESDDFGRPQLILFYATWAYDKNRDSLRRALPLLRQRIRDPSIALMCDGEEVENGDTPHWVLRAIREGTVCGCIATTQHPPIVLRTLRLLCEGVTVLPCSLTRTIYGSGLDCHSVDIATPNPIVAAGEFALTPRESDVLRLLTQGKANKLIAFELGVEENTVKVHVRSILKKLGVHNRTEAVALITPTLSRCHFSPPDSPQSSANSEPGQCIVI